jgi:ABC-type Fe3+-siderophore transport system permease subunit
MPDPKPTTSPDQQPKGSAWAGFALALLLHLLQLPITFLVDFVSRAELAFLYPLVFIGISQLVYIIPAIIIFHRRGEPQTVKGLLIGASLTFLLNAACSGLIYNGISQLTEPASLTWFRIFPMLRGARIVCPVHINLDG